MVKTRRALARVNSNSGGNTTDLVVPSGCETSGDIAVFEKEPQGSASVNTSAQNIGVETDGAHKEYIHKDNNSPIDRSDEAIHAGSTQNHDGTGSNSETESPDRRATKALGSGRDEETQNEGLLDSAGTKIRSHRKRGNKWTHRKRKEAPRQRSTPLRRSETDKSKEDTPAVSTQDANEMTREDEGNAVTPRESQRTLRRSAREKRPTPKAVALSVEKCTSAEEKTAIDRNPHDPQRVKSQRGLKRKRDELYLDTEDISEKEYLSTQEETRRRLHEQLPYAYAGGLAPDAPCIDRLIYAANWVEMHPDPDQETFTGGSLPVSDSRLTLREKWKLEQLSEIAAGCKRL